MGTVHDFHDGSPVHPAASVSSSFTSPGNRVSAALTSYRPVVGKPGGIGGNPGGGTGTGSGGTGGGPPTVTGGNPVQNRPVALGGDSNTSGTTGGQQGTTTDPTTTDTSGTNDPISELIALAAAMGSQGSGTSGDTVAVPIDSGTPQGPSASGGSSGKGVVVLVVLGFFIGIGFLAWKYRDKLFGKHGSKAA